MKTGVLLFLCSCAAFAQSFSVTISSLEPNEAIYPGDNVKLGANVTATVPANTALSAHRIRLILVEQRNDGLIREVGTGTQSVDPARSVFVSARYIVPLQLCVGEKPSCPPFPRRVSLTVKVQLETTAGVVMASAAPVAVPVTYPQGVTLSPATQQFMTTAHLKLSTPGVRVLDNAEDMAMLAIQKADNPNLDFRFQLKPSAPATCTWGEMYATGVQACDEKSTGPSMVEFDLRANERSYTAAEAATKSGSYHIYASGIVDAKPKTYPNGEISRGRTDIVGLNAFQFTAPPMDDSIVLDPVTVRVGAGKETTLKPGVTNQLGAVTPGQLIGFRAPAQIHLARAGEAYFYAIIRDSETKKILASGWLATVWFGPDYGPAIIHNSFRPIAMLAWEYDGKVQGVEFLAALGPFDPANWETLAMDKAYGLSAPTTVLIQSEPGDKGQAEPKNPPPPPTRSDTAFVATPGPGFDGSCVYNDRNPYRYLLNIPRYVGELDNQGYLIASKQAVENRLISAYATLRLAVWDFDGTSTDGLEPEVDFVDFNGFQLGAGDTPARLTGTDKRWKINEFKVPISLVKFARRGARGEPPTGDPNVIQITADTANQLKGNKSYCVALGWAALEFDAVAPLMLVHGTNAQSDTWELNVVKQSPVEYLNSIGAVFEHKIDMLKNGSARENGTMLYSMLAGEAVRHGVKGLHLITHSKGATDSRYMLSNLYRTGPAETPFQVLSLFSIGTPSMGTILSDYSLAAEIVSAVQLTSRSPIILPEEAQAALADAQTANFAAWLGLAPEDPARALQSLAGMAKFNAQVDPLKPPEVPYYSLAGNADASLDKHITWQEAFGMLPAVTPENILAWAGERMYQALGLTAEITYTSPDPETPFVVGKLANVSMRESPEPNDLVSLAASTHCLPCGFQQLGTFPYNHSGLKSPDVLKVILDQIRALYPVRDR